MLSPSPETQGTAANAAQPAPAEARVKRLSRPIAAVLVGVALIGVAALAETILLRNQAWKDALLVLDGSPPANAEGIIPISLRRIPLELSPRVQAVVERVRAAFPDAKEDIDRLQLDKGERVILMSAPVDTLTPLLASGRLPVPGKREALAGDLASRSTFDLDGASFSVVGRLQRGVAGLAYAYVIPEDPAVQQHFTAESGATEGWIDPEGFKRLKEDETYLEDQESPKLVGGITRSPPWVASLVVAGLFLVACGGSVLQVRLLRHSAARAPGFLRAVLREIIERPALVIFVHAALYGVFFLMMLVAFQYPVANIRATSLVRDEFAKGELSYIGNAYASGDIFLAAAATFFHNYVYATLLFALAPSLIVPFAGLIKNLLSFASVGFVMAPIWAESGAKLVYHSITMALEMEGYIIASFVVVVWPLRIFKGVTGSAFLDQLAQGLRIVVSGALLAGIMLAIAALYEATTLIILNPWT
jgi:hypothetical protein